MVKNLPAMLETWVRSLSWENPLEKEKATRSSILVWRISWTIVHEVSKSGTRLSDFHFTKLLRHEGAKQSRHVFMLARLTKRETDT